jgi:hypothetical protein
LAAMAKPVILVVEGEDASLKALQGSLIRGMGAHYRVVPCAAAEQALARLGEFQAAAALGRSGSTCPARRGH